MAIHNPFSRPSTDDDARDGLFDLEGVQCHLGTICYSARAAIGRRTPPSRSNRALPVSGGTRRAFAVRRKLIIKLGTTLYSYVE